MGKPRSRSEKTRRAVNTPIWQELLLPVEMLCLRVSPVYWGFGVSPGDGSGVILIPGLMGPDLYLGELGAWLARIGYRPYFSGIGLNADCPNLLIRQRLTDTIERAYSETGQRVHLIGHSLGGLLARAVTCQARGKVASVTTLGSPFRGIAAHPSVLRVVEWIEAGIHRRHGEHVLPECYTGACTCEFLESLATDIPVCVRQTAVYTKSDGLVDWRVCRTGDPAVDIEVSATHFGLVFSPAVYEVLSQRLAACRDNGCNGARCA